MPHINVLVASVNGREKNLIIEYKSEIRRCLSEVSGYDMNEITLIARVLLPVEVALSDNLLPLEFVVDIGKKPLTLSDESAKVLKETIIQNCPKMASVNFGVWVRGMQNNGFCEHKPV